MSRDEATDSSPQGERLQKLISRAGLSSRRAAEDLIRAGRVTINGRVAQLGDRAQLDQDAVKVDGKRLLATRVHHTLALNKPTGVVTTLSDPEGRRTVIDLVPPRYRKGLFPVGRLDFATEGLLLLTTDGDLAQRIGHPRYGCRKQYEVKVKGQPTEQALDRLRRGFKLHGKMLAPVEIQRRIPPGPKRGSGAVTNTWWRIGLVEGKTRQIREMFQRIGHPVQRLRRVQIGPVRLLGLPLGGLRELGDEELAKLTASVSGDGGSLKKRQRSPSKSKPQRRSKPAGNASRGPSKTEAAPKPRQRGDQKPVRKPTKPAAKRPAGRGSVTGSSSGRKR